MKTKLLCVALLLGTTSMVRADEIADLKAATQKLAKQNQELAAKLAAIEKRQHKVEAKVETKTVQATADASSGNAQMTYEGFAKWQAADLGRRLLDKNDNSTLTFMGITLYGGIDVGASYQSHGTPLSSYYSPGLEYVVTKNSNHSLFSFAPDALSQSNVGLKGVEPVYGDLSGVFNLQFAFNPQSGIVPDNLRALTGENGVPNANQVSGGDSSRAGQALVNAYAGVSSARFGTLTFGRQNSLFLDGILAYDPMGGSNAFSIIGYQGAWSGAGATEDARLDNSIKYRVNYGPVRAAAMYKFSAPGEVNGQTIQGQVGFDYLGFSFDGLFSHQDDQVTASALSTSATAAGGIGTVQASQLAQGNGLLNFTAADVTGFGAMAKYTINAFKFYAGYENFLYKNPKTPLSTGDVGLGGYVVDYVNNNAYTVNKDLQMMWIGVKYAFRPDIDLTLSYYHEIQSSFGGSNAGSYLVGTAPAANTSTLGCSTIIASNCHGTLDGVSGLIDYRLTKRFDIYAGAMWSTVHGGLANGFNPSGAYQATSGQSAAGTIDPTVGARFQF